MMTYLEFDEDNINVEKCYFVGYYRVLLCNLHKVVTADALDETVEYFRGMEPYVEGVHIAPIDNEFLVTPFIYTDAELPATLASGRACDFVRNNCEIQRADTDEIVHYARGH